MSFESVTIEGTVVDVTFQNEENGFTVIEFSGDGEYFNATGLLGNVYPGEKLTLTGHFENHHTFGRQFRIEGCIRGIPETSEEMLSFLSSGLIKGVREKTARKIVAEFGDQSFEIIENHPERLAKINGISRDKAKEISRAFNQMSGERNAIIALEKYGLTSNESLRIFRKYKSHSVDMVENNPYFLSNAGIGINFERAAEIASRLSKSPADDFKIQEGIIYVLRHNLSNGHTCIPRKQLSAPVYELTGATEESFEKNLDTLISQKRLFSAVAFNKDFIFLPEYYEAEKSISKDILFIKNFATKTYADIDKEIGRAELIGGVVYNEKQRLAIKLAVEKGILILTGGPGTGKTTTLRGILKVLQNQGLEVALAAPTGRAAKRMSELTGKDAQTIHRLLEVEWDDNDRAAFKRNRSNPISCDAVIIDELSMVDALLFSALLEALPLGCRLIMVGDSDQLPAVGPGNVLHDLIDSKTIPVVELDEIFRQAMESLIVSNSHKIVCGEMPDLTSKDKDFFFMERNAPSAAASTICELVSARLPKAYNYSPCEDIQVLCPSKKGETGTVSLNIELQKMLNPHSKTKKEHNFGNRVFRVGDKLMQTKNNYDIMWKSDDKDGTGIFNGDIGILEDINENELILKIKFDDKTALIPFEAAKDIEHAYAITVHKSQGNEFPAVIIPVTGINEFLKYRNLLYTAVTRAKNLIILVGSASTVAEMVENNKKQRRYSALRSFLTLGDE